MWRRTGLTTGEPMCDAPYEYYSAIEYIHKAREEVGYSDYEAAIDLVRDEEPDLESIDPSRFPPAYRERIRRYYERLSEQP